MKKLKQIIADTKAFTGPSDSKELTALLWQLICYPPKMPLRLLQSQLLDEARKFKVLVNDKYFICNDLAINGFIWGNGPRKLLITHGWGSKAGDFTEIITALRENADWQIIAFDAPANGSSEGELSNLLLFSDAVKAVIVETGTPDIVIGHSLGAMANVIALNDLGIIPRLLVSLTPFMLLKENFTSSMTAAGVPQEAQDIFFQDFKERYHIPASYFAMNNVYKFDAHLNHWLAYDEHDALLPYAYLDDFLKTHPSIRTHNFDNAGHERIIRSPQLISALLREVSAIK